jgi:hypothetical protein
MNKNNKDYKSLYRKYKKKYLIAKHNNLLGGAKLLYQDESDFQKIHLYQENNNIWLTLNDQIQFHSKEYKISHYLQCNVPLKKFKPKKILILGGGDGIAASFVLKHPFVESVTLVEIDKNMIKMIKTSEQMRKITNNVAYNEKLNIIIGDGIQFVFNCEEKYDLIIDDIEYDFTNQPKEFSEFQYMKKLLRLTNILSFSEPESDILGEKVDYRKEFPTFYNIYMDIIKSKELKFEPYIGNKYNIFKEMDYSESFLKELENDDFLEKFNMDISGYNYGYDGNTNFGFEMYVILHKL